MNTKLYVIGNGFDLHHGIPSAYKDFGRFLKTRNPEIYGLVEEYFGIDDKFWSDFEARLATFDAYALMGQTSDFLTPYGADDWRDSSHHNYSYEINKVVEALSGGLKSQFATWIRQLEIPDPTTIPSKLLRIDGNATFLNFNYTPSLTTLYGVRQSNVHHVHGSATDADNDLILGHGRKPAEDRLDSEEPDTRVIDGNQAIDQYFKQTFKPTDRVIAAHQPFFEGLRDIQRILVMGHRLADVDLPYFREIVRHVDGRNVHWQISYYPPDNDLPRLRRQLVNLDCVPEDLVEFTRLVDF